MYRIRVARSLLVLFLVGIVGLNASAPTAVTSPPMNAYRQRLEQVVKANRSFQLPDAEVLTKTISSPGMEYFLEKTDLINKLASRHLKEIGIYMAVDLAYYDFAKYLKDDMTDSMLELIMITLEEMKPNLIEAILHVSKEITSEQ